MSSNEYGSSDQPQPDRPGAAGSFSDARDDHPGRPDQSGYRQAPDYSNQAHYGQSPAQPDYGQPPAQPDYGQPSTPLDYGRSGYRPPATASYPPVAPGYQPAGYQHGSDYASGGYPPPGAGYPQADAGYPSGGYSHGGGYPAWQVQPDRPASDGEGSTAKLRRRPLVVLALIAALIGGGIGGGIVALADRSGGKSVNTGLRITNSTGAPAAKLDGTVSAAAARIRPSVVTINVAGQQEAGTGSGVIIRDDGTILTNDHVIDIANGAGTIQVVLADGRTAAGKILGRDTSDDLAVIKVDGMTDLTAATFAKSSSLTVGQTVVAVGAPLGLSDTVTSGIVSSIARPVRAGDNDQAVFNAVQTDAAINPGNSGGPLVDLNGSVVGINAAIASNGSGGGLQIPGQATQSGNIGIGFAIPSDEASRIAGELIANGKATHAVLGVEVENSTNLTGPAGVTLHSVNPGGVADKAGLKAGDRVTKLGDQQVSTADALIAAVRSHAPGEQVSVGYTRGGKSATVTVTLGSSDS
ncbi:MAG TPA: trypsin-like peptidase domain-containing protein [Jatrophihabitans sp.]|nr:trypsin-like peptidase domain-containing protein [Jatrophihabitans sp.]